MRQASIFHFDQYTVNAGTFEVFRSGERLPVEPQVLDLLIFLLQNRDRVVAKEEVFEVVWKNRLVTDATLSSRIKAVRQLIGDDGATQRFVRTIHGRGFRFTHEVRVEESGGARSYPVEARASPTRTAPEVRYARSGDVHIAYQLFGSGPVNLVLAPGFVSHIDNYWDCAPLNAWLTRLGQLARVAMFDKRGTGLSDPVPELPGMDQRMDDVRAVMDAAGFDEAVIMGVSEGGSLASLFGASHPERCQGLILYGAFAKFNAWFPTPESLQELFDYIRTDWGTGKSLPRFAPSAADDPALQQWWGKFERLGATPGTAIALMRMNSKIDISEILPAIQAPTLVLHRTGDVLIDIEGGRELARYIPGARLVEYPGDDHLSFVGDDVEDMLAEIERFLADLPTDTRIDRTLATLLIAKLDGTDDLQECAQQAADHRQRDRLLRHALTRYRGREVELAGDTLVAAFDGPARALKCALTLVDEFGRFDIPIRAGVHTGELQVRDDSLSGVALDIASSIAALAEGGGVIASRTVKDLVAGSGIEFDDFGEHLVPEVSEPWQLFRVVEARSPVSAPLKRR
ncbi:alpha/beta fold hydrolase [Nitratireductor sp. GCM10026969]|uniref:alpha/beta fold hydrolase n=1 Tax=Nitratireductor sp. GCM10026969 TaxID=3252645 RepID=UPI003606BFB4